ncbi:hypothetical protein ILUMI_02412 [Ignelater luminosus]|uniref:UDP-glucuronosyltransferase n=1 Tax=Ignelater luminosus TaxID=2038154 RepID=A0A8K0GJA6_IGNLU|nr:hypothetical protein ILUMI_02412 [Ignelater luminosus]
MFSVLLSLLFVITPTFSARILGIVSTPSYSHQIVFRPLWKELSLRGHQVTVLTTDPIKDASLTNLTEIDLHFSYKTFQSRLSMNEMAKLNPLELIDGIVKLGYDLIEEQLQYSEVQKLLKSETERFDVILVETFFAATVAFSHKFNCPLIQIFSLDASSPIYYSIGNPSHPILNPEFLSAYKEQPNFLERLMMVASHLFVNIGFAPRVFEAQQLLIKKYFGENYPRVEDILRNTSLLFVNTDTIFHPLRPLLPNVIQIGGGTHLTPPKPLPKDLQKHLDGATNGFIYFSLGNNVKSELLSENTRKVLLETFAKLPCKVLWKFEQQDLAGKPDNVIISKWFPQQDIFKHVNIKLFITHGGQQSTEEAIYHHVPMIGMPFIGDQKTNVQRIVDKGMGLSLDYNTLDKETFRKAILEVMNNPKYRTKVKELAELAKDQPMSGLQRAIWWTEYVIRHKGARHLRSPALDLPLYQYLLLDLAPNNQTPTDLGSLLNFTAMLQNANNEVRRPGKCIQFKPRQQNMKSLTPWSAVEKKTRLRNTGSRAH